jgi:thymidylate synthase (FAD)
MVDYTGAGASDPADHAANVLIFTKSTRLEMQPSLMETIKDWSHEKKMTELEYMASTIPSSWEFVDYTFLITGVTRAFTHQFVRTRTASYAQQTMRVLNVEGWGYLSGPTIRDDNAREMEYQCSMEEISNSYNRLISMGAKIEDARGILPTNILTNIVMKCSMRTLTELVRKRSSPRTQGEYRDVLEAMKEAAISVHPWLHLFLDRSFDRAAADLDSEIVAIKDPDKRIRMIKLVDQLRKGA